MERERIASGSSMLLPFNPESTLFGSQWIMDNGCEEIDSE